MSESAAIINPFFIPPLHETASTDTLQAAGAKDRALLGSNLSVDSGAKTKLGLSGKLGLSEINSLGLASAR
jgi:hypothetical protein